MCKGSNNCKMTQKHLYRSTALLFALNIKKHRCKLVEQNNCSDMAPVHGHIVAETFHSNKS